MTPWAQIAGLAALLALGAYLYLKVVVPFNQLREALRRLAARDFRPVLLESRWRIFRRTSTEIDHISELLQQLDRQIADEGFSLRAILSSMVEGVLITDRTIRIRLVNEPLYQMFDFRPPLVNRSVIEVFQSMELQRAIEHTLHTGAARLIELALPSGRFLEVHAAPLDPRAGKRPLGAVVVFHDITAVKNLEVMRREFMANVSHEFRTPLTIINGYIETLLDGALDDRPMTEKSLRVMHKNGQRLTLLIEDLMTLSKMENRAAAHLDFRTVDLRTLLTRVLERLDSAVGERRAQVHLDWVAGDTRVEVDPQRIEQVFSNLLENALRYGPPEGLRLEVSGRRLEDEVQITFADNGPGIPLEDQPHIFERFYRVHKDRSRVAGGTGLGLSIVKHIMLAHGGSVSVASQPGQGAAFSLNFPLSQSRGDLPPEPPEPKRTGRRLDDKFLAQ